jgi:lipoate-protein ligase A
MSVWRLLSDLDVGAADGLAADEALMLHYGRSCEPCEYAATLRLYTYRPHCALVGRYQELTSEVNLNACSALGVDVGRRPTGGGAIIMGPDQLGIAVTTCAPAGIGPRDLLRQYAEGIIMGLARVGVCARFRGKNDLEVRGRKVAGLGLYLDERGALLLHASVLADLDVELMLSLLRIPGAKLADKGVERVADRITTVTRETGSRWSGADLRNAISDGFRETLGVELASSRLDAFERVRAGELTVDRYGEPAWLAGRSIAPGRRGTAALKTPEGFVRVYAAVQGDVLSSVLLAGDFSAMPPGLLRFEAALRWCRADPERIADVARTELVGDELGVSADAIGAAVWSAAERALERAGGATPVRTEGSCYYPERVAVV